MDVVTGKVLCYCCAGSMFNVKNMTLEPISNSLFSLSCIFNVALITFQTISKIVALADAIPDSVVGFLI